MIEKSEYRQPLNLSINKGSELIEGLRIIRMNTAPSNHNIVKGKKHLPTN